jgi:hypothetical protein
MVVLPILYAAVTPWLLAGAASAWTRATARLGEAFAIPLPGLGIATNQIFGSDPDSAAKYLGAAGIDLLCILGACLCAFSFLPRPRLRPKPDGMQIKFLNDLVKGFRLGRKRNALRVGGEAGGVASAMLVIVLILWGLQATVLAPMQSGRFFADVRTDCSVTTSVPAVELADESALPDCLEIAAWRLGWNASLAGLAVPIALLIAFNYAIYPVWLLRGRPTGRDPAGR